jgi:hypothetical protein
MAVGPKKSVRIWTFAEASGVLPYLRLLLRDVREGFIAIWHLYRLGGGDVNHPDFRDRIRRLGGEARAVLDEFDRLGVILYQSPLRGIALFPIFVHQSKGVRREAYFVYKDTREEIDTYIFADDLCDRNDLYTNEKPVPQEWKEPGVVPGLEREGQP